MEKLALITFRHRGSLYGAEAKSVVEMTGLPELTPIEEAPAYIAGIFSLRGRFVPVIDLDKRFNHAGARYSTEDCVIVAEAAGMLYGIIVNEISEVRLFDPAEVQSVRTGANDPRCAGFIKGEARLEDEILMVLDIEKLQMETSELEEKTASTEYVFFCPDAAPEEKEVFRARARGLASFAQGADTSSLVPLAVVTLSGERYALELEHVLGFTDVRDVTPVPCCPPHIKGELNLRGGLLTVVDIRNLLGFETQGQHIGANAVLVEVAGVRAGVLADEILEVGFYPAPDPSMVPAALNSGDGAFIKGVSMGGEGGGGHHAVIVIDLQGVFESGGLVVDETV